MDATLKEIAALFQDHVPAAKDKRCRLGMALVFPNPTGRLEIKRIGVVASRPGADDEKTLAALGFQPGDYLSIALLK